MRYFPKFECRKVSITTEGTSALLTSQEVDNNRFPEKSIL